MIQGGKIPRVEGEMAVIKEAQAQDYKKETEALVSTAQKYVTNLFQVC